MHNFDPHQTLVGPVDHLVPSWTAHRPGGHGRVLCHPVPVKVPYNDMELHLAYFLKGRTANSLSPEHAHKKFGRFQSQIPTFTKNTDVIAYMNTVTVLGAVLGCYVLPLPTIREDNRMGVWYEGLPPEIQAESQALSTVLWRAAYARRSSVRTIAESHDDGYNAWYALAEHAGHPCLNEFAALPSEPHQKVDESFLKRATNWHHYVLSQMLHGLYLSAIVPFAMIPPYMKLWLAFATFPSVILFPKCLVLTVSVTRF